MVNSLKKYLKLIAKIQGRNSLSPEYVEECTKLYEELKYIRHQGDKMHVCEYLQWILDSDPKLVTQCREAAIAKDKQLEIEKC